MGLIEDELSDVRQLCHNRVPDSRLVTCVRQQVRIHVRRTEAKQLIMCFQFPADYPHRPILLELKSTTLADKLLEGLARVCESEASKHIGRPHVLPVAEFVRRFLDEQPLCCCWEELTRVRSLLEEKASDGGDGGGLKLRQKASTVALWLRKGRYELKASVYVPDEYPQQRVTLTLSECSLPSALRRWLHGQSDEIARTCVEPPLRAAPAAQFQLRPSLEPVVRFVVGEFSDVVVAVCPQCELRALPAEPADCVEDGGADLHVERVYCGHLYHFGCLVQYMKTPPFSGGKLCKLCGKRIFHDKYKVSPQLAEARWAQEQARQRELNEVVDFLS